MNIIDDLQNDEPRRRIFNEIPKGLKVLNNIHPPELLFFSPSFPSFLFKKKKSKLLKKKKKKKKKWKMNIIDDLRNDEPRRRIFNEIAKDS